MRKLTGQAAGVSFWTAAMLLLCSLPRPALAQDSSVTSILVVPIQILSSPDIGRITSDEIVEKFTDTPAYTFIDWDDLLDRVAEDRDVPQAFRDRPDCIVGNQLATFENIDLVVCGRVFIGGASVNLEVMMTIMDTASGRTTDIPSFKVESQEEAIQRIADELQQWLENRGSAEGPTA